MQDYYDNVNTCSCSNGSCSAYNNATMMEPATAMPMNNDGDRRIGGFGRPGFGGFGRPGFGGFGRPGFGGFGVPFLLGTAVGASTYRPYPYYQPYPYYPPYPYYY